MLSRTDVAHLPIEEYAFPGPLRDRLVAAILNRSKTSTTSLVAEYERDGEALPRVGDRGVVVDSAEKPVCVTEVVEVRIVPLGHVDVAHARDEGEGFDDVASWRSGHEEFWLSAEFRDEIKDPAFSVSDDTKALLVRFRVVDLVE